MARRIVPVQKASKKETFETLCADFSIDADVGQFLVATGVQNLEELRFLFTAEEKVEPWLTKMPNINDRIALQGARVRRAWNAVRLASVQREQDRSRVDTADLDDPLDEGELRDVKVLFWRRYRQRFPPDVCPSDALVSRMSREVRKRMLMVYPIWKVRNLTCQVQSGKKRKKVGEGFFTEEVEEHDNLDPTLDNYLDKLFTYLLALAVAGVQAAPSAPPADQENTLGAETTKFVSIPMDILQLYWFRAKRTAAKQPVARRLQWLEYQDAEE